ncbi:Protein of unknown function [Oceanospirillum multiglobuliferum]|uniref:DUF3010 domain-containing protein n=1 Tax=Oceanospirillum multiglobuliferum TaxID=64969 RepID=A0A1T4PH08_9GAMM|nr:DUF3010 family protein [Oceanospirillum multiglobuliferum]OPX55559.1 hypothetical protein BTE48_08030 [Oceanospirillum multiglobuliferum]SJZ90536.1 Protein of unknown function [Oceanospirillum multiglobuliferum]
MRVCGVELKGNEALICLLSKSGELFDIPDCRQVRFSIKDSDDQQQMRFFQQSFRKLMEDYKVEQVVIRQRLHKGKFAGGAVGFKLEGALQALSNMPVTIFAPSKIKEQLKHTPLPIDFSQTGLKAFQEVAFVTAFAFLNKPEIVALANKTKPELNTAKASDAVETAKTKQAVETPIEQPAAAQEPENASAEKFNPWKR